MERIGVAPGTEIGGYQVLGPLGQGGMGAVYRAVDGEGTVVALKLLHPHLAADADARERLRREVAHLQRVRHPGVARVVDAEIESTEAFVVTELVDGEDLGARIRLRGPLPPVELADVAERLRAALAVVHEAGVLHRDLTPGNVMVTPRGPVLIDFGIAQAVDDARVTSTGLVVGTPGYLSPELLEGAEPSQDGDWWGWAALLAFAATGRPPFGTRPLQAVLARARAGEPDLDGVAPRTAAALRAALRTEASRRATPEAVVAELRRSAGGEPDLDDAEAAAASADDVGTRVLTAGAAPGLADDDLPGDDLPDDDLPDDEYDDDAYGDDAYGDDLTETQLVGSDGRTCVLATAPPPPAPPQRPPPPPPPDATQVVPAYGAGVLPGDGDDRRGDPYPDAHDDDPYDDGAPDDDEVEDVVEPEPPRRTGTVLALGLLLAAAGATRPGIALLVALVLAVLVRSVGLDVAALHARRARRGTSRAGTVGAVVGWPWYLLRALVGVVPAALVAASTVVVVAGVGWWLVDSGHVLVAAPEPGSTAGELARNAAWVPPALLALAVTVGLLMLWFGPMSRSTRLGARWTLGALAPGLPGAATLTILALAAAAALVTLVVVGQDVVWWPLPGPPELR
ncbi:protein kinase domain-containing protein [Actinotalea subterranea]|uniref:protein kinase domain-containing protein n=1 Tax=Actinotalea subterranea TaxID=2607497 RepID=UPI001CAA838C|nr:serine/threonine-protein kinase [Actinotalea subterranea]